MLPKISQIQASFLLSYTLAPNTYRDLSSHPLLPKESLKEFILADSPLGEKMRKVN